MLLLRRGARSRRLVQAACGDLPEGLARLTAASTKAGGKRRAAGRSFTSVEQKKKKKKNKGNEERAGFAKKPYGCSFTNFEQKEEKKGNEEQASFATTPCEKVEMEMRKACGTIRRKRGSYGISATRSL